MKMDEQYIKLARVAEEIPVGEYTTKELMLYFANKYRKGRPAERWYPWVNRAIDELVRNEFMEFDPEQEKCYRKPESGFATYTLVEAMGDQWLQLINAIDDE